MNITPETKTRLVNIFATALTGAITVLAGGYTAKFGKKALAKSDPHALPEGMGEGDEAVEQEA